MRPRRSILTGGFDFSGCGDFTSCPPVERAEMSNSEPSAIVLQGIACIGGLYIRIRFDWGCAMISSGRDDRVGDVHALKPKPGLSGLPVGFRPRASCARP